MTAHQFKVGDRVEVVEADQNATWKFIRGRGVGMVTGFSDIDPADVCVLMDDPALMAPGFLEEAPAGWYISASSLRLLSPPAPDALTATALELAEAVDALWDKFNEPYDPRLRNALRAYRDARRPEPRARLRALIEQHGGDDKAALLAVIDSGEAS